MRKKRFGLNMLPVMTVLFIGAALQPVRGTDKNLNYCHDDIFAKDAMLETASLLNVSEKLTCGPDGMVYFFDDFNNVKESRKLWVQSQAKEDHSDGEPLAKYDGSWRWEEPIIPWKDDVGLVLKSKATHSAISAPLRQPFTFKGNKPLVVQYEVMMQGGQDCGGAYIKLLSAGQQTDDLTEFSDNTPYTIMFGPDNCGRDYKIHFIFRHINPINGDITEQHCRQPTVDLEKFFTDKLPHLYQLIVWPDNNFEIHVDSWTVKKGSLLEDFDPPVNPPSMIEEPAAGENLLLEDVNPLVDPVQCVDTSTVMACLNSAEHAKKAELLEDSKPPMAPLRDIAAPMAKKYVDLIDDDQAEDLEHAKNPRGIGASTFENPVDLAEGEQESSFPHDFEQPLNPPLEIDASALKISVDLDDDLEHLLDLGASTFENSVDLAEGEHESSLPKEFEPPLDPLEIGASTLEKINDLTEDEDESSLAEDSEPPENASCDMETAAIEKSVDLTEGDMRDALIIDSPVNPLREMDDVVEKQGSSIVDVEPNVNPIREINEPAVKKFVDCAERENEAPNTPHPQTTPRRKIPNPNFFEDLTPFQMTPISAVGIEVWSMSNNVLFDNFVITDNVNLANDYAAKTFSPKQIYIARQTKSFADTLVENPWPFAVCAFLLSVLLTVLIYNFVPDKDVRDRAAQAKKTDATQKDVAVIPGGSDGKTMEDRPVAKQKKSDLDVKEECCSSFSGESGTSGDCDNEVVDVDGENDDCEEQASDTEELDLGELDVDLYLGDFEDGDWEDEDWVVDVANNDLKQVTDVEAKQTVEECPAETEAAPAERIPLSDDPREESQSDQISLDSTTD